MVEDHFGVGAGGLDGFGVITKFPHDRKFIERSEMRYLRDSTSGQLLLEHLNVRAQLFMIDAE